MKSYVFCLMICLFSNSALAADWTWSDFEIVGYKNAKREEIARLIPISLGSKYVENPELWSQICQNIKEKFNFHYTHCSTVKYVDFKAYFLVEIVERGGEDRIKFRSTSNRQIALASPEVLDLYEKLYARLFGLFSQGVAIMENSKSGYLDYSDPEMSEIAWKLSKLVPHFHSNLLEVLAFEASAEARAKAANLLNWSMHPVEDVVFAVTFLDDPSELVRNNISRFAMAFVNKIEDTTARRKVIDAFVVQLKRPSHGDRNKALYSLLNLVKTYPRDAEYLESVGAEVIREIASQSILSNVKGPADDLKALFKR